MIRLGFRLTLAGGREAAVRLALIAAAVAVGVGLLLISVAGMNAVNAQNARYAWLNTGTGSANCSGTYFLPKGKLMVAGVLAERLLYELAVIGGTGFYQDARGTLTVTVIGDSPRHELLMFRLSG